MRVVVGQRGVAVANGLPVEASSGAGVGADPLGEYDQGDEQDRCLAEAPGDATAGGLIGDRVAPQRFGRYRPNRLTTNAVTVTPGCEITVANRECSPRTSSRRGAPAGPAAGSTRKAKVIGAPRSNRIGASIDNTMCCAMWTLNSAVPNTATPVQVTTSKVTRPSSHATVRPSGQATPRRRSTTSAPTYPAASAAMTISQPGYGCQLVRSPHSTGPLLCDAGTGVSTGPS